MKLDVALRASRHTQTSIARRAGITRWRFSKIVNGHARSRPEEREAIGIALGLPVAALFADGE